MIQWSYQQDIISRRIHLQQPYTTDLIKPDKQKASREFQGFKKQNLKETAAALPFSSSDLHARWISNPCHPTHCSTTEVLEIPLWYLAACAEMDSYEEFHQAATKT